MTFSFLALWIKEEKRIANTYTGQIRMVGCKWVEGGGLYSWVSAQALPFDMRRSRILVPRCKDSLSWCQIAERHWNVSASSFAQCSRNHHDQTTIERWSLPSTSSWFPLYLGLTLPTAALIPLCTQGRRNSTLTYLLVWTRTNLNQCFPERRPSLY